MSGTEPATSPYCKLPNKVGAGTGAGALSSHIERVGRALPDVCRLA